VGFGGSFGARHAEHVPNAELDKFCLAPSAAHLRRDGEELGKADGRAGRPAREAHRMLNAAAPLRAMNLGHGLLLGKLYGIDLSGVNDHNMMP